MATAMVARHPVVEVLPSFIGFSFDDVRTRRGRRELLCGRDLD
jgi:hypothetical protein